MWGHWRRPRTGILGSSERLLESVSQGELRQAYVCVNPEGETLVPEARHCHHFTICINWEK